MNARIVIASVLLWFGSSAWSAEPPNSECKQPFSEHRYVSIGGIEQWVTIDTADCTLPVLLIVHGGPGNPISPYIDQLYGSWKTSFTIATWDQRLSGKTYLRNEPVVELTEERLEATNLTLAQLINDGLEVADYLKRRLGKRKLILTGTSWGSVLGVHMARQQPGSFHAYIGVSQLVDARENLSVSYAATLEMATRKQDANAIATLQELGAPPWTNPRNLGRLRRIVRAYETELSTEAPKLERSSEYTSQSDLAAYEAGEEISFIEYVGLAGDGIARQVDLRALGTKFEVPMFFIQGEADLLTHPSVTRTYFDLLEAPRKKLVMVPRAGHDPNFAMLEAQRKLLQEEVLPLIK